MLSESRLRGLGICSATVIPLSCLKPIHNFPIGRTQSSATTANYFHSTHYSAALSYGDLGTGLAGVDLPKEEKKEMQPPPLGSRHSGTHVPHLTMHLGDHNCSVPHYEFHL